MQVRLPHTLEPFEKLWKEKIFRFRAISSLPTGMWDHVFGMSVLNAPTIAQQGTAKELQKLATYDWRDAALDARVEAGLEIAFCRDMIKLELPERSDLRLRTPDISFTDFLSFDLGGVTCELHHVGGDHAADSSVLYIPEDKVLFLGDCISQAIYSPRQHYTAAKGLALFDKLLAFNAESYLESHNEAVLSKEDFQAVARALRGAAEVIVGGGDTEKLRTVLKSQPDLPPEDLDELVTLFMDGLQAGKEQTNET